MAAAGTVRVATWNLYLGADLSGLLGVAPAGVGPAGDAELLVAQVGRQVESTAFPRRARAVARVLAREAPDVLAVQELCTWTLDGAPLWDFEALLGRALAEEGVGYDVAVSQATFRGDAQTGQGGLGLVCDNAVLVRRDAGLEVARTRRGTFASARSARLAGVGVVEVTRGWCSVEVRTADGVWLEVFSAHTEDQDERVRTAQQRELLTLVTGSDGRRRADRAADAAAGRTLVVGADLNVTPDRLGAVGLLDAWAAAGPAADLGPTWGQAPDLRNEDSSLAARIDYLLVGGPVTVRSAWRAGHRTEDRAHADGGDLWPSDHAAVLADVVVGGPA